jgi:hypothetical protein
MSQFYIDAKFRDRVKYCEDSLKNRTSIVASGIAVDGGGTRFFTGVVQLIETDSGGSPGQEIRITMRDTGE